MAFVRKSAFRHLFGTAARKAECYEGFRVTNCAFEGNFIAVNPKFVAFCVEVGRGGAFVIVPLEKNGRLDVNLPKVSAHKEYVLDLKWNPYNDNMIASCSEDGSIRIWEIPDSGLSTDIDDSKALLSLDYHERRCVMIEWHPCASNVLLSVSQEPKICIWNLDDGTAEMEITCHPDVIYSAAWDRLGSYIVTTCKDKKIRVFEARSGDLIFEGNGHEGSKPSRAIFLGDTTRLFTTGFSKMSERQYAVWDVSYSSGKLSLLNIKELDTANGVLIPHYDHDTRVVYLAAKGDSVIRYYEMVDESVHYIGTYQSSSPQRGVAFTPKRGVDVNTCEVAKMYKLHGTKSGVIEPIPWTVPRKSDLYQGDLYPDAVGEEAALEASEWFEGRNAAPKTFPMLSKFKVKSTQSHEVEGKSETKPIKKKDTQKLPTKEVKELETDTQKLPTKEVKELETDTQKLSIKEVKEMGTLEEKVDKLLEIMIKMGERISALESK